MALPAREDAQLLRAAGESAPAFEALLRPRLPLIYGYIRTRVGDEADAQDILQETMLAVWRGIARFQGDSGLNTWVLAIARRRIADHYRRACRDGPALGLEEAEELPDGEDPYGALDESLALEEALAALRPGERELLYLVFEAGLPYAQAARVLEIPVGTVKSRMAAIREKLRTRLE